MSSQSSGSSVSNSAGQSTSSGQSASKSANTSFLVPQPALGYEGQWNSALQSLQQQQYEWAQQQYQKNSYLTDQMVSNAANFANPERIHQDMGAAESGVAQSMDAQRQALNQTLQSYGINPGDPKYAGALAASRTAQGAAMAAAGQTANRADVATGNQLRQQALGDVYQNTGVGANILGTSPGYANTGVQNVKFAPLGSQGTSNSASVNAAQSTNQSHSQSQNQSSGTSPTSGGGSRGSGDGSGGGSSGSGGSSGGTAPGAGSGGDGSGPGGGSYDPGGYSGGNTQSNPYYDPYAGGDPNLGNQQGALNNGVYGPSQGDYAPGSGDPSTNPGGNQDQSFGAGPDGGYSPDSYQTGSGDYSSTGSFSPGSYSGNTDYGTADQPTYTDSGMAAGGAVGGIPDDGTTGGHVDSNLSPSRGAITDDVPARLNAEEFVVPRDVARWKGEEFFHKLIQQSRQAREGVTAKPQQKPMTTKDAVSTMRSPGFQSKPVLHAFAGGGIPDGGGPETNAMPAQQASAFVLPAMQVSTPPGTAYN
jgi:hypothetical protein